MDSTGELASTAPSFDIPPVAIPPDSASPGGELRAPAPAPRATATDGGSCSPAERLRAQPAAQPPSPHTEMALRTARSMLASRNEAHRHAETVLFVMQQLAPDDIRSELERMVTPRSKASRADECDSSAHTLHTERSLASARSNPSGYSQPPSGHASHRSIAAPTGGASPDQRHALPAAARTAPDLSLIHI